MFIAYAALVALLSLNRETGGVLVALYVAWFLHDWRRQAVRLFLLTLVWASVQIALHLSLGSAPHQLGLAGTLAYNLNTLADAFFANLLLLPLVILTALNYSRLTPLLKRLLWVAGLYILAILVGGAWNESQRLILPVLPLVLISFPYRDSVL